MADRVYVDPDSKQSLGEPTPQQAGPSRVHVNPDDVEDAPREVGHSEFNEQGSAPPDPARASVQAEVEKAMGIKDDAPAPAPVKKAPVKKASAKK